MPTKMTVAAFARTSSAAACRLPTSMPMLGQELRAAADHARAVDRTDHALADRRIEVGDRRQGTACAPARPRRWRPPAGVRSLVRRWRASEARSSASKPGAGSDVHDLRAALGQGSGLVDHQRVDLLHPLERLGVADQHAVLRTLADADHDGHRRGQAERTGAGDDEHGHGRDERVGEGRTRPPQQPGDEGQDAPRRSPPARTSLPPGRPCAGSARGCAGPPRPCGRSARAGCRRRPSRRA